MFMQTKQLTVIVVAVAMTLMSTASFAAKPLDEAMKIEKQLVRSHAASQKRIDRLAESTRDMAAEYQQVMMEIDNLKAYNAQLESLIRDQQNTMARLQREMDNIDKTEAAVSPLMQDMIDRLEQFVDLDMPFLMQERRERIQKLRNNRNRSDLTESEKFRQILEAYTIEMNYGQSIEAYEDTVENDAGEKIRVNFLRFGRTALLYQTLDEKVTKYWDNVNRQWVALDNSYRIPVRNAIKIAKGMANPNLVTLPVSAAKSAGE